MSKNTVLILLLIPLFAFVLKESIPLALPIHFPDPVYDFNENPIKNDVAELGRELFYDPVLSKDSTISCASCHSSFNAFAHTDHALSHGIYNSIGTRNAPALFNLAWQDKFMWDGAVNHIEVQALAPIHNAGEMAETMENVIGKLQKSERYPVLFYKAFGDSIVTGQHILKAIAQFELSLVSGNAKYDKVIKGEDVFTEQENNGYKLFKENCNSCHTAPLFSNYQFASNGLPVDKDLNDFGKWKVTKNGNDSLLFKIPSLRNLSYTYPYMHDGRFHTLYQVINHYTAGINTHPNISQQLRTGIKLSPNDKIDLISFLLTLNDHEFIRNPDFQHPGFDASRYK